MESVEVLQALKKLRQDCDVDAFMDVLNLDPPAVGTHVKTIVGGFGDMYGGQILQVLDHVKKGDKDKRKPNTIWGGDYIVLSHHEIDRHYLVEPERWWKKIRPVKA
jgi:hypothetical protein